VLEERRQLAFEDVIDLTHVGGIGWSRREPKLTVMTRIADALSVALPKLLSE